LARKFLIRAYLLDEKENLRGKKCENVVTGLKVRHGLISYGKLDFAVPSPSPYDSLEIRR
jgi:hypothetical protein